MSNYEYAQATDEDLMDWQHLAWLAEMDAVIWERQQSQVRWAEAGGHKAGLARPAA